MLNAPVDRPQVLARVRDELAAILSRRGAAIPAIEEETRLAELGIASLDLAEVISNLESVFDVDPFADTVAITDITTVASLANAYLQCLVPGQPGRDDLDEELRAIRARTNPAGDERHRS